MSRVSRGKGFNPSEQYLSALCDSSFLSLWSYPNTFRAKAKELCDLIVVFGDNVILFSSKECAFPATPDKALNWTRWYKRAVLESIAQLDRAEEWVRNHPTRIYLDPKCEVLFPISVPERPKFHRVVVATGAARRCREELGGSGSLMIVPPIDCVEQVPTTPFCIGPLRTKRGMVHLLDEVSLPLVLGELDTIHDLIEYLEKKEAFFETGRFLLAPGEDDLLAFYLTERGPVRDFLLPEDADQSIVLSEGFWDRLVASEEYQRRKLTEAASYQWDRILEEFNGLIFEGAMMLGNERGIAGHETRVRLLAAASRQARGLLVKAMHDFLQKAAPDQISFRAASIPSRSNIGYVFVLVPRFPEVSEEQYRQARATILFIYVARYLKQESALEAVVGIATETDRKHGHSEDVIAMRAAEWSDEHEKNLQAVLTDFPVPVFERLVESSFSTTVSTVT